MVPKSKSILRKTTPAQNRRYYLHQIVKRVGFKYDPYERTVFVSANYNNNNIYVRELCMKFNYNIQFEIK